MALSPEKIRKLRSMGLERVHQYKAYEDQQAAENCKILPIAILGGLGGGLAIIWLLTLFV